MELLLEVWALPFGSVARPAESSFTNGNNAIYHEGNNVYVTKEKRKEANLGEIGKGSLSRNGGRPSIKEFKV